MARFGLLVDLTKCVGCGSCTVTCQAQNQLYSEEHWLRVEITEEGTFPAVTKRFLPISCMHCDNAPCITVCPTRANHKRPDGIVLVDESLCVGCKYCVVACPYQARVFIEDRGIPQKCVLCYTRVEKGVQPACVLACPAHARYFGDYDDPDSDVSRLLVQKKALQLRPDLGTKPNIYYVR